MCAQKKTAPQRKYRPSAQPRFLQTENLFYLITVKNADEIRRGIARNFDDHWAGWLIDTPAMLKICWPKFAWYLIMQKTFVPDDYPPDTCTCNKFDKTQYGVREDGQHHKWCPYHPSRQWEI